MNLVDYLPRQLIEVARKIAESDPIVVYAPEDPDDITRKVRAPMSMHLGPLAFFGHLLKSEELLSLHALGELVRGGAKVIRPSIDVCRLASEIELNIHIGDYAQPYAGMGVVIPKEIARTPIDVLAVCHWSPGLGIHISTNCQDLLLYQTIGPHWPQTIEEHFSFNFESWPATHVDCPDEAVKLISRVVLNLGLFGVEKGIREKPLDDKARRRRIRAKKEPRFAELSARDAQEFVIQELDLIAARLNRTGTDGGMHGGLQTPHRRRGHWKMQPCGPLRSQRKRIYVQSYLVNVEDGTEVQTLLR